MKSPSQELCILAIDLVCNNRSRNLFQQVKSSDHLQGKEAQITDSVLGCNAYFAHPENMLFVVLTAE